MQSNEIRTKQMSGNATSMIGLCQEGKSSPDALGRSAGVNSFGFFAACLGFSARGSFVFEEPDFHLLAQPFQLTRRSSLCFPASLETNPWEYPELALFRQSRYRQDLAGDASKNSSLFTAVRYAAIELLVSGTRKFLCPRSTAIR